MQPNLSELALRAAVDERAREQLIHSQERAILAIASRAAHRYLTKSDDEWSVALYAFSNAIDTYSPDKGAFVHYAELLIRRRLVDYYRSQSRHADEINVSPIAFESGAEDESGYDAAVQSTVARQSVQASDTALRDEILSASEALASYGFRFMDLTECCPKQEKTRKDCMAAVQAMLHLPEALKQMRRTHQLPMALLAKQSCVARKTLERYRKYIIAVTVILCGEYPGLQSYLNKSGKEALR